MADVDTNATRRISLALNKGGGVVIVVITIVVKSNVNILVRCGISLRKTTIWVGTSHEVELLNRIILEKVPARNAPHFFVSKDCVFVGCR